MNLKMRHRY